MPKKESKQTRKIPEKTIQNKILLFRRRRVMLDHDLAELYDIETRSLNQAVKRNPNPLNHESNFINHNMTSWRILCLQKLTPMP